MFSGLPRFNFFSSVQQVRQVSFLPRAAVNAIESLAEAPKRAKTSYNLFFVEQYPQMNKQFPNFGVTEIAKRIGAKWTGLSDATKKSYADRAEKGLEGAKQQMDQFKKGLTDRQSFALHMLRMNTKARRGEFTRRMLTEDEKNFLADMPKAPFSTGRHIYIASEMKKSSNKRPVTERLPEIVAAWKALPESQKAQYEQQAKKDMQHYMDAMKKFLLHK